MRRNAGSVFVCLGAAVLVIAACGDAPGRDEDGWTYDPATNSVTFHGTACDMIKDGTIIDIDVVYGCNMPPTG